jgi:hypothetical protein
MRMFQSLPEAASEIQRDLSKAPIVRSSRVQNLRVAGVAREWLNYSYSIKGKDFPPSKEELLDTMAEYSSFWATNRTALSAWLSAQISERMFPETVLGKVPTDQKHPALKQFAHGGEFDYRYGERLIGAHDAVISALMKDPYTRRAYWPMFSPLDSTRAASDVRIPCSLGWAYAIRPVEGIGNFLQVTYLQRSCDFARYWASDVWFTLRLQKSLQLQLDHFFKTNPTESIHNVEVGDFTHIVLSLHQFFNEDDEVY